MAAMHQKSSIRIDKSELLCKQGCGFYGNRQWEGLCSKCWREVKFKDDKSKSRFKPNVNLFGLSETLSEKRKLATNMRASAVSTLFGKSKEQASKQPSRQTSRESIQVGKEFVQFLKSLKQNEITQDISNQVSMISERLGMLSDSASIDEVSETAVNFYQDMTSRISSNPFYQSLTNDLSAQLQDFIEKYIATRLYNKLFSPPTSNDEESDLLLQARIRSLHWISVHILDVDIDERQDGVSEEIESAITAIIEMNSKRSPLEKLVQIVTSSNHILAALKLTKQGPASADDFLPTLIYVVLKANPPLLESNIRFITRFANPKRLMTGEAGYYFTNLCCAVAFIRDLNASSLSMPESEFENCMNGKSLPYDPRLTLQRQRECLALMQSNVRQLEDIKVSQEALMSQAMQLQQDVIDFCSGFNERVHRICEDNPLKVRQGRTKVDLDARTDDGNLLPAPIQPQVLSYSSLSQLIIPRSTSRTLDLIVNPIICTNVVEINKNEAQSKYEPAKLSSIDSLSKLSLSLEQVSAQIDANVPGTITSSNSNGFSDLPFNFCSSTKLNVSSSQQEKSSNTDDLVVGLEKFEKGEKSENIECEVGVDCCSELDKINSVANAGNVQIDFDVDPFMLLRDEYTEADETLLNIDITNVQE